MTKDHDEPPGSPDPDRNGAPGRRHEARIPVDADVRVTKPVKADGVVLNASVGGLRIAVDREVPVGQACEFEVWSDGELRKTLTAVVVWSKEHPDGWVLGIDAHEPVPEE